MAVEKEGTGTIGARESKRKKFIGLKPMLMHQSSIIHINYIYTSHDQLL
jgi:hypothetical protein